MSTHGRGREEVVGRGARRLEEQALLAGDAAVGPVRQQHEGHRGAIVAVLAVVLPQGPTTTQAGVRVVPQASHRVNQTLVFTIRRPALIAREVVPRPAIAVRVGLAGNCDVDGVPPANAPRVRALAVLRREPSAWHLMEEEQLDDAGDRHHNDSGRRTDDGPFSRSGGAHANALHHEVHGVHDAHHHQHETQEIEERKQTRIPQQADDRKAVARHVDGCHQRETHDAQPCTGEITFDHAADETDQRKAADDDVPERAEVEEHFPEAVAAAVGPEAVLHVGHVGVVLQEWKHPERGEGKRGDAHGEPVDEPGLVHPDEPHQQCTERYEDQHDAVREHGEREQHGSPVAVLARLQPTSKKTKSQDAERQRDRERELASHGAGYIAAVNGEALVEEEDQPGHRHQFRDGIAEAGKATECPAAERQCHDAETDDDLERDSVGEDDVERNDHQRGHDHVEAVQREAVVPIVAPPGDLTVGQQVVAQVRRGHHVCAHIATRRSVVLEHEIEVNHLQHRHGAATDHCQRCQILDNAFHRPRSVDPVRWAACDATPHSIANTRPLRRRRLGHFRSQRLCGGGLVEAVICGTVIRKRVVDHDGGHSFRRFTDSGVRSRGESHRFTSRPPGSGRWR